MSANAEITIKLTEWRGAELASLIRDAANAAERATADDMLDVMRTAAPVRTGKLKTEWTEFPGRAKTGGGELVVKSGARGGGEDAYYAWWVEFGHYNRGGSHTAEQPYARPAMDVGESVFPGHVITKVGGVVNG